MKVGQARQPHFETSSRAEAVAHRIDGPAVHVDDASRQGQPESEATGCPGQALPALLKGLEDLPENRRLDSQSVAFTWGIDLGIDLQNRLLDSQSMVFTRGVDLGTDFRHKKAPFWSPKVDIFVPEIV